LKILLISNPALSVLERAPAVAPGVEFFAREAVEVKPTLLGEIEVSFGFPPPEWLARMPALRWAQAGWAGVGGALTPEVLAHRAVYTAAHIHAEPIAEHLFAMLLAFTRGLPTAMRQQEEHRWAGYGPADTLPGKTLGLLGVGAIGRRAAELGAAFGMRVLGLRRTGNPAPSVERMFTPEEKAELLPLCDVVMNTLPLTPCTERFLGPAEFALLKPGALLFNIGRGKTIDTAALIEALHSGRLAGAGLDVTDPEPLPPDHPLWDAPNVIITPHNSGGHADNAERVAALFLANLRRYLAGEALEGVVDKEEGY
jgi:phosphoglycerate dehydrogenase-like enzyme